LAKFRYFIRPLLTVILLGGTILGLVNVMGDNTMVQQEAKRVACGGKECPTQLTKMERTPFGQSFEIVASRKGTRGGSTVVSVKCKQTYLLFGKWGCTAPP